MTPKVTVVIPCYNHGQYLNEAVQSVLRQTLQNVEIVIVNDGSTDKDTNRLLSNSSWTRTTVITIANQGVAVARNIGIENASGEYILPLDADDIITATYLEQAAHILDTRSNIGIVYSKAAFFDAKTGIWDLPEYNFPRILAQNLIFCSGMYRKSDWLKTSGYNLNMREGWEDWDFWLSLIELGIQVYRIPEVCMFYRIRSGSRNSSMSVGARQRMFRQLYENHRDIYDKHQDALFLGLQILDIMDRETVRWQVNLQTLFFMTLDKIRFWRQRTSAFLFNVEHAIIFANILDVKGWILSKRGLMDIRRVEVLCDNILVGCADYGLPRSDVSQKYPHIVQSERSGFHFRANISRLLVDSKQSHAITVNVVGLNGYKQRKKTLTTA